jgi:transcription antitermination protein NusB
VTARRQARSAALQILYFWQVSGADPAEAVDAFFAEHQPDATASIREFAGELVHGVVREAADLDRLIAAHAEHWRVERLSLIDLQVLRLAAWELRHHHAETPPAVVLNEALELARTFSGDESVPFVNGVLDGIRRGLEQGREPK